MRLKKDNVERIATTESGILKLKRAGFKEVEPVKNAPDQQGQTCDAEAVVDMEDMTVDALKVLAKEKGLKGYSSLSKEELLTLLKEVI